MAYVFPPLPANGGLGWNSLSTAELIRWCPPVSLIESWRRQLEFIRGLREVGE